MKPILIILAILSLAPRSAVSADSSYDRARLHPLTCDRPAPDFFAGALLGNGGMGVVVCTRPDSVLLHFGHNNVWDIRLAEDNRDKIGTFQEVFARVKAIPETLSKLDEDPWYKAYSTMARENYSKPYPRPFPCGTVLLGFDPRRVELLGHRLDVSDGLCEVQFLVAGAKRVTLQLFTDMSRDRLWLRLVDDKGNPGGNIFERVRILPDPSTPPEFPKAQLEEDLPHGVLGFRQTMPYAEPAKYDKAKGHPKDRAFRLTVALNSPMAKRSRIDWHGNEQTMPPLEAGITTSTGFVGCIDLEEGLSGAVAGHWATIDPPQLAEFATALQRTRQLWRAYWDKSGVKLGDPFLERIWYQNLYFLNCATKAGVITPGLFANWSYDKIGTKWHGDYHFNYNVQQPFWVTFSSNHLEKNLPYVELIERLMPVSRRWAREYYGLPGAYFPHSAYPVEMTMNPYPAPTWGWEVCETPWAVQGLWWHYLYSGSTDFLKSRAWDPIKAAVEFLVAYMKRPEASGPQWQNDKFHIFPTVPPELYGLRPGFKYNHDCNVDLTLTKFVFKAFIEACRVLDREGAETGLLADVRMILSRFPDYPTADSAEYGKVFVSAPGEHDRVIYNTPTPLFSVFPGDDHGLHSDSGTMQILQNTLRNHQNEGGNDLVFLNLQAARLGQLDLERFKRHINYCLMPNGTASNRNRQALGRHRDNHDYLFMDRMGIWFENFALPVVVNECLMQSYDGTIRLFPNWPLHQDAEFTDLRAAGAFLVSAHLKDGEVQRVAVVSEAGGHLRVLSPWPRGCTVESGRGIARLNSAVIETSTEKGEVILLYP